MFFFKFPTELFTSGLLNTIIRTTTTTTTVSANPTIKQENQLHNESQGYYFMYSYDYENK